MRFRKSSLTVAALLALLVTIGLASPSGAQVTTGDFAFDEITSNAEGFGYSVAVDGDTMVIGAIGTDFLPGPGRAFIYTRNQDGTWSQQQTLENDDPDSELFGHQVVIDGDTIAVASPQNGFSDGEVFIYTRNSNSWGLTDQLFGEPLFGQSLALEDGTLLIGNGSGFFSGPNDSVLVYTRNEKGRWTEQQRLEGEPDGGFGISVAIDGDTIAVGEPGRNDQGAVHIFTRSDSTWVLDQTLASNAPVVQSIYSGNFFGFSVALDDNNLVVGAPVEAPEVEGNAHGAAYFYSLDNGTWTLRNTFTDLSQDANEKIGFSVAIGGDTALVGAGFQPADGSAYVFTLNENSWSQTSRLLPANSNESGALGSSVAIGDDTFFVGAPDQNNDAGALHLFARSSSGSVAFCDGHEVTVNLANGQTPTSGDDVILGTNGDDVIDALGGNDIICAQGGNDTIHAGSGRDRVFGQDGKDTISGGRGADVIDGGTGNDELHGNNGNDTLRGDRGNDNLFGDDGKDTLNGGNGNDDLFGDADGDTIVGANGNDNIRGGSGQDDIRGNAGDDVIKAGKGADQLSGGNGNDDLDGGKGLDTNSGGNGTDTCAADADGLAEILADCEL